ncbi:MAG: SHOCT domain-containing protein [Armatimonadota bacterium]|nr:SHOCT domain-containing protein [Armatimonadota bacterium]MDR7402266.1 SHOCT domain-containing protein [Armatimonadota bacterium]MDR7437868.1 SHOCT domain-containing protein [Armatimonadota bacterium]MDR7473318.1 SHOCT domain-containing protein [Armatimonadota bacterium]MDR7507658.1 SHOCT domain-containing protein [Armatimonadota bacterium]
MSGRDLALVVLAVLGGLALLSVVGMGMWGGCCGWMGPGMMGRWGWGPWGGGWGLMGMLLVLAGIVLVVLALTRRESRSDEALEILRRRLASGEITREQYEELRKTLQ